MSMRWLSESVLRLPWWLATTHQCGVPGACGAARLGEEKMWNIARCDVCVSSVQLDLPSLTHLRPSMPDPAGYLGDNVHPTHLYFRRSIASALA